MKREDLNFDRFLEVCDQDKIIIVNKDNPNPNRLVAIAPNDEADAARLLDRLDFYFNAWVLIKDYPQCRQMVIDGVHRYERTGVKFQVCYNFCEYPDGEAPNDFVPIVLHFPS